MNLDVWYTDTDRRGFFAGGTHTVALDFLFQSASMFLYDYSVPQKNGTCLRFPCCNENSLCQRVFFYELLISQAQGRSTHTSASLLSILYLPKQGLSLGKFERMWLPSLHLGFWPPTKLDKECTPSNLPDPNFCWLLLLGRSAHRVIQVSLRGPLLTVPLSLLQVSSSTLPPPNEAQSQARWPQGRLLGNLWNLKPPAFSFSIRRKQLIAPVEQPHAGRRGRVARSTQQAGCGIHLLQTCRRTGGLAACYLLAASIEQIPKNPSVSQL